MHLLKRQPRELTGSAVAADLGQSPGDIVILSAADTEISGLAAARRALGEDFPSVRLANWLQLTHPYSVDLYGEQVLSRANLVVLRLLGGASYWRYGLDEAVRLARANGTLLAVLPGDATWDAALAGEGTVAADIAQKLWAYLVESGSENLARALRFCAHLIGEGEEPEPAQPLPSAGFYRAPSIGELEPSPNGRGWLRTSRARGSGAGEHSPTPQPLIRPLRGHLLPTGEGRVAPTAAIIFYRALLQAGQTEPVDALCKAVAECGLKPLPIFVSSLKAKEDAAFVAAALAESGAAIVLNATAFALSQPGGRNVGTILDGGERPVLQVTFAGISEAEWAQSSRGLSPADLTMNVVLPEVDGRVIGRAVSFKEAGELDPLTECRPVRYRPKADRIDFVAELAARWVRLRGTPNSKKRVAILLSNYPNRDGRLANGVGLDAPASVAIVLAAMRNAGCRLEGAPESGAELMALLLSGATNARHVKGRTLSRGERVSPKATGLRRAEAASAARAGEGVRRWPYCSLSAAAPPHPAAPQPPSPDGRRGSSGAALSLTEYARHFEELPETVQAAVTARWGAPETDPFVTDGHFILPAHRFGNVVIGIQPARGYNIDPKATYHDPDLAPPHGYLAFYIWLREIFGTDALIHMGKHGNLEWLPGKALALSEECFPEAALGAVPLIYPFIVNDPGEGAQAKRRTAAVVVDHLMPPITRAESHGPAVELEALIDEYAAAVVGDPRRARIVVGQISELAQTHGFDRDLGLDLREGAEAALPKLDEHICDLKELQIRDGLHVLGRGPEGQQRAETLVALARVPRAGGRRGDASLLRALAEDLKLGFDPLGCRFADPWEGPRPLALFPPPLRGRDGNGGRPQAPSSRPFPTPNPLPQGGGGRAWRTYGDTVERLEVLALSLVEGASCPVEWRATNAVLLAIREEIGPALDASGAAEIDSVLNALAGKFVPPGPSGAPTRGRVDCLPTGRNFYSVDVRAVPTPAAWELGRRSAALLAERYFQDEGEWPKAIALTVWGTSNMRTGGDDIAQALALIGVRPVWERASGRVTGCEVMPLSELKRPRIDVTLRISGFFRDAFPSQIGLFHEAVQAAAEQREPPDANPIAARIRGDARLLEEAGLAVAEALRAASFRVFGAKPGAYGAGLQALIDEGIWTERKDLAAAFLEWSAYAYGGGAEGEGARGIFETRLRTTDAVVQNQDNREHDILDSDDYYQFEGGLSAAVETLRGSTPKVFHNDHSRPEHPKIRMLEEEVARVVRGRAANPKWIAGVMRHGYKGVFEIAATVDYLFAFAATTNAVRHHHFDQLYDAYLGDTAVRGFIAESNPPALAEMAQKFCEAVDRGLWAPRRNSAYDDLKQLAGRMAA